MPPFTKRAILDTFLEILAKKPFEKITVRDLVDACGLNRNTFYYYFRDIFGVLEELFGGDRPIYDGESAPNTAFFGLLEFTYRHRRAFHSLFVSLGSEGTLKYLFPAFRQSLSSALSASTLHFADTQERDAYLVALCYMTGGFYMDWLRAGCRENIEKTAEKYAKTLRKMLPEAGENQTKV